MNTNHTSTEEGGGTGLLLVVSFSVLLTVIAMAILVIGAVIRTIDDGSLVGASKQREQDERKPAGEPVRPLPRMVPGH